MARGGKRDGAGRPPGAVTTRTREMADQAAKEGLMPLEYMLSVLRNGDETMENRCWAAEKAAPYVHPRLANVEMNASVKVSHEDALEQLG